MKKMTVLGSVSCVDSKYAESLVLCEGSMKTRKILIHLQTLERQAVPDAPLCQ